MGPNYAPLVVDGLAACAACAAAGCPACREPAFTAAFDADRLYGVRYAAGLPRPNGRRPVRAEWRSRSGWPHAGRSPSEAAVALARDLAALAQARFVGGAARRSWPAMKRAMDLDAAMRRRWPDVAPAPRRAAAVEAPGPPPRVLYTLSDALGVPPALLLDLPVSRPACLMCKGPGCDACRDLVAYAAYDGTRLFRVDVYRHDGTAWSEPPLYVHWENAAGLVLDHPREEAIALALSLVVHYQLDQAANREMADRGDPFDPASRKLFAVPQEYRRRIDQRWSPRGNRRAVEGDLRARAEGSRHFLGPVRSASVWWSGAELSFSAGRAGAQPVTKSLVLADSALLEGWLARWCAARAAEGLVEVAAGTEADRLVRLGAWDGVTPVVVTLGAVGVRAAVQVARLESKPYRVDALEPIAPTEEARFDDAASAVGWLDDREQAWRARGALPIGEEPTLDELPPPPAPIRALERTAWLPERGESPDPVGWTGGLPRLDEGVAWPIGPDGTPLAFAGAFRHPAIGWFQLFFDAVDAVREDSVVVVAGLGLVERAAPHGVRVFPRQTIAAWREVVDLPASAARAWEALYDRPPSSLLHGRCHVGLKLGGWPAWIQNDDTPEVHGDELALLVQLQSDPKGWMWGHDSGVLYVFGDHVPHHAASVIQGH